MTSLSFEPSQQQSQPILLSEQQQSDSTTEESTLPSQSEQQPIYSISSILGTKWNETCVHQEKHDQNSPSEKKHVTKENGIIAKKNHFFLF